MTTEDQSVDLLRRFREGDELAAQQLFDRYVQRLVVLARTRLSDRMKRRVEPEDVVQSVYRSFFRKAGEGHFTLGKSGDLWSLLATITIMKVRGQVEFHTAKKRGIDAETPHDQASRSAIGPDVIAREPSPEDATAMIEELEIVMRDLDPTQRQILELSLQNLSEEQICEEVQRSGRTVRRTLQKIRDDLQQRL